MRCIEAMITDGIREAERRAYEDPVRPVCIMTMGQIKTNGESQGFSLPIRARRECPDFEAVKDWTIPHDCASGEVGRIFGAYYLRHPSHCYAITGVREGALVVTVYKVARGRTGKEVDGRTEAVTA